MKKLKFIAVFLLFLLAFISGSEFRRYAVEPAIYHSQESFLSSKKPIISYVNLTDSKEVDIHTKVKKKIKYRATTLENSTLRTFYYSKLINFKIFKSRSLYGMATIYQIQRHTYLHLYQLF